MDTQESLSYIESLSQKHFESIGFLPRTALAEYYAAGRVALQFDNDEPCGFLIWGGNRGIVRIFQTCIQVDAQRRDHGMALVRRLINYALAQQKTAIVLRCANDLEANEFWRALGFEFCGVADGGSRRRRKLNLWRMDLQPTLFELTE